MFNNEKELREKCKDELLKRSIRIKYFSFLYSLAKEDIPSWDYDKIYYSFINLLDKVIKFNLV